MPTGPTWLLTLCVLAFAALLLCLHLILSHTEKGKYMCSKRSMHNRWTKKRHGANMRINLFWICSRGKGGRDEDFGELGMKHWRWEDTEQKEGPSGTGTKRKSQTFFLPLPRYYLARRQPTFSFHVTSMYEKPSWRYWVTTGQNKISAMTSGFGPAS